MPKARAVSLVLKLALCAVVATIALTSALLGAPQPDPAAPQPSHEALQPAPAAIRPAAAGADAARAAVAADGPAVPASETLARRDLVVVDASSQHLLIDANMPVVWKGAAFALAEWTVDEAQRAGATGIPFQTLYEGITGANAVYIFELHDSDEEPSTELKDRLMYRKGHRLVVEMTPEEAEALMVRGEHGIRVPHIARGWDTTASLVPFNCAFSPVTASLLAGSSQTQWVDWIEKFSGTEPVSLAGNNVTIATRYSSTMFQGAAQAKGYDYLLQQLAFWNYAPAAIEQDPFTGTGGATWKNVILTIPGQTTPSEIVVLSAHFDSLSQNPTNVAPGADDNGTGIATLMEAARLFRQYRFQRTVKIIWFTGEEQGLIGSAAYVADHPMAAIQGVVNLDMFGYDSNADRCFEIHVGTLAKSADVGNCFRDSITSYGTGLGHDYLTSGATDRSDHASFWNGNVGAIEIAENFFTDNLPGGCPASDANPGYHTISDTLAGNMHPGFGYDIAKTAIATVSAMALPIGSCFASTPALTATSIEDAVDLSWTATAGAGSYRIYRSTGGCQGSWTQVATVPGTSWTDATATLNQAYSYYVEAVHTDGTCISGPSTCSSATPTIHEATAISSTFTDTCPSGGPGSGNGFLDPGENVTLRVTLKNDGNVNLTGVAGVLSTTTPGVTVTDPATTWPNITPGGSALSNADHFAFTIGSGVSCGTNIAANGAISYAGGSNNTPLNLPMGSQGQATLINESFAGGIPGSWTVVNGGTGGANGAATWTTANPGNRVIGIPIATPWAIVDSDRAGAFATQDESLLTPVIDASGCGSTTLDFSNQFRYLNFGPNEVADVDISSNGGGSWTNVLRMTGSDNGYPTPNTKTIDITSFVAQNPTGLRIRFRYYSGSFDYWWAIDNVRVRCNRLLCTPCIAPPSSPGEAGVTPLLTVGRAGNTLNLAWGAPPCATGYGVYRGNVQTLRTTGYSHGTSLACGLAAPAFSIAANDPRLGAADYFLVVAENGSQEGSYGRSSAGAERPSSAAECRATQNLGACP